jgi:triphosphoribosyl-dephospho-CoA synthase
MPFKSSQDAAIAATLSMLLEVSGSPKAGNVDRDHNFSDLRYEHFLASSSAAFPVFLRAAEKDGSVGELVYLCVENSLKWQKAGNVHFGAFLLLIPLIMKWDTGDAWSVARSAVETLKGNEGDCQYVMRAFRLSGARVMDAAEKSLESEEDEIRGLNLYEWMKLAPEENFIARELVEGYPLSLKGMELLLYFAKEDLNRAIVLTYHHLLSELIDPLIISKLGFNTAIKVRDMAKEAVKRYEDRGIEVFRELDEKLLKMGANPGSVADLTISSIYLALLEGLRP